MAAENSFDIVCKIDMQEVTNALDQARREIDTRYDLKGTKNEERKEEDKNKTFHLWERTYGEFERTFRFPMNVNEAKVSAEFNNGILTVKVPKVEVTPPAVRTVPIAKK